jgi:hypothetical protein
VSSLYSSLCLSCFLIDGLASRARKTTRGLLFRFLQTHNKRYISRSPLTTQAMFIVLHLVSTTNT